MVFGAVNKFEMNEKGEINSKWPTKIQFYLFNRVLACIWAPFFQTHSTKYMHFHSVSILFLDYFKYRKFTAAVLLITAPEICFSMSFVFYPYFLFTKGKPGREREKERDREKGKRFDITWWIHPSRVKNKFALISTSTSNRFIAVYTWCNMLMCRY